jgi:GrpB-like predicted nucleotidyltransferase (UPF0157 family)
MTTDSVIIAPYDPEWPLRFEAERSVLARVFLGTEAAIEHVGSTAVPGLSAKPVIDVMVGLKALVDVEGRIPALEAVGYEYDPGHETQLPERRYFRKPRLRPRAFHLHCVVLGSDFWIRQLAFRDYLRAHGDTATAYDQLKRHLAARLSMQEYTQAKSPFILGVLADAMEKAVGES